MADRSEPDHDVDDDERESDHRHLHGMEEPSPELRAEWERRQLEMKQQLDLTDNFPWYFPPDGPSPGHDVPLRLIGGVDISFVKESVIDACASLVVLSYPELEVVYMSFEKVQLHLPYLSGFLGFREVPFLLQLLDVLRSTHPELYPSLLLVDGNGYLHSRGFGSACHLGVLSGTPTIGVAKKLHVVDGITSDRVRELMKTAKPRVPVPLVGDSGCVWGHVRRSRMLPAC